MSGVWTPHPFHMAHGLALATVLFLAGVGRSDDSYYVLVFAAQDEPNLPRHSHTWATFIKASGDGPHPCAYRLEAHTISWQPQTLVIEPLRLRPEAGVNLDLEATLRWAQALHLDLYAWGPYRIDAALYERALTRIAYLQAGSARYKAIDAGYPGPEVMDCIHAVSDLSSGTPAVRLGTPGWGRVASGVVVRGFQPWIADPEHTCDWVATGIGLNLAAFQRGRGDAP